LFSIFCRISAAKGPVEGVEFQVGVVSKGPW
jgi:hypothetical protein